MEKTELLAKLRELKEKILHFDNLSDEIKGTEGIIDHIRSEIKSETKEANKIQSHLRKHEPERQAAYQKDIDIHNAKVRTHRGHAEALKRDLNDYNNKLASLKSSLAEAASVVSSDTTLPNVYKDQEIVDTLIGYLEKLRADSLKEAINLFEYESKMDAHNSSMQRAAWASANHSWQQAEASRRMAAEAERQTEAAEEAAREARRAVRQTSRRAISSRSGTEITADIINGFMADTDNIRCK